MSRLALRARVVLPVSRPPIDNGAVLVSAGRIEAVGPWTEFSVRCDAPVTDFGDAILLPGLVNAHCHLDYTDMAGLVPATRSFTDWIKSITALKATWSYTEFAKSWVNGANMLLRHGATTVADIEAVPELLPDVWRATPLRVFSFLEMTGVRSRRQPAAILAEAVRTVESLPAGRGSAGLSPHAPYSTTPELQRLSADTCRRRRWLLTTHAAESSEEFEVFRQRNMGDCGRHSPIRQLHELGVLGERTLAVHVNCLGEGDEQLLSATQTSVVHCPQSRRFFNHPAFPFERLRRAGVNICLGTDSLASTRAARGQAAELNLFDEMRAFASDWPGVSAQEIVGMATRNGARALGLAGQAGELSPGAFADLIAVPFSGAAENAWDGVLEHQGPVAASLIDGAWATEPELLAS
jgi:aminodeoxyfutalosine deaminase